MTETKARYPQVTFCLGDYFPLDEEQLLTTLSLIEGPPVERELYKHYRQRVFARITKLLKPGLDYPSSTDRAMKAAVMFMVSAAMKQYYEGRFEPRSLSYRVYRRLGGGKFSEECVTSEEFSPL